MTVEFGLLGEVTVHVHGEPADLGPARRRCVLAALAVDANQVVPSDRLIERVWGENPPYRTKLTLSSYISRLRQALPTAVKLRSGGYVLETPKSTVDAHRFQGLCAEAAVAEDEEAARLLTAALGLWRGPALTGIGGAWAEQTRERLDQQRLTVASDLVDVRLRLGEGSRLVDELAERAEAQPLDERVAAQYMLALYRSGRGADALEHHRRLREALVEELGADPCQAVQDLYQQILVGDPALRSGGGHPVPRQLPALPATFVGRHDELAELDEPSPVITVVGAGGMGKTWLALRWAHHNLDRFPDGQLHVDLRGFSPEGTSMPASVAVRGFLDALGVQADRMPVDPHAQSALLRSMVADKRILMVVDNAADTEHVTPLLPGATGATVLVTSRHHLLGLVTAHGARQVTLGSMAESEARELLTFRLPGATAADIDDVIRLCGGFPLALGIIAGRAGSQPHLPLNVIAEELRALGIDALDSDEPAASLPTVLSWSHQALTEEQSRAFELLAVAPGPDIALPAAASLLDRTPGRTSALLGTLERMSFLARDSRGRYGMHDLVRQYGTERARVVTAEERDAALERVVTFYIGSARFHDSLLDRFRRPPKEITPVPGTATDTIGALAWFDTEHACLLACIQTAVARKRHDHVWQLAWVMASYHWRRGHLHDDLASWQAGLAAVQELDDKGLLALAHQVLGCAHARLHQRDVGLAHLDQALELADGDYLRETHVHLALSLWRSVNGEERRALAHAKRALEGYQTLGMPFQEANTLNGVGWIHAQLGEYDEATSYCEAALALHRELGSRSLEASALNSLGRIAHLVGDGRRSLEHYEAVLAIYRECDETYQIPFSLTRIGEALCQLGRADEAVRTWREALAMFTDRGQREDADFVRDKIASAPTIRATGP